MPEACAWLVPGYYVSRACLVQGGASFTLIMADFLAFQGALPWTTISIHYSWRLPTAPLWGLRSFE